MNEQYMFSIEELIGEDLRATIYQIDDLDFPFNRYRFFYEVWVAIHHRRDFTFKQKEDLITKL